MEPGGELLTPKELDQANLRADLVHLISQIQFNRAAKIADAILSVYSLSPKPVVGVGDLP